jgi:uncharacterized membrane protein YdjX (TVP38/TMEM64 family)
VRQYLTQALAWVASLGPFGPVAFILLYILACVAMLPASLLTLGAGALFGLVRGFLIVSLASTLGATAAFLIGRTLARRWVASKIAANPRFAAIDAAVAQQGAKIVFLLRLSPILPFNLLNYALSLTQVSLRDYVLASWIGMMPGTILYVYLGSLAGDLAGLGPQKNPAQRALFILGLAATVLAAVLITRAAKKALNERL